MKSYFYGKKIVVEDQDVEEGYLVVENGKIVDIVKTIEDDSEDIEVIDYSDSVIAPGLVDTHIHGYKGHDVMDNDFDGIKVISEGLLSCGVTSWLPTTLTSSIELLNDVCQTIGDHMGEETGAKIQGIFLEGPFFTEKHKGAQNPGYMMDPQIKILDKWQALAKGAIRKIAIAPERDGVEAFTKWAVENGIHVALAHSDATFDEAKAAVDAGADIFIHTFNGMSGLHHREPGMAGAALSLDNVYCEVISDGYHVHPAAVKIIVKARGTDETVLITDCMRAGGQGEGDSMLGEFPVYVKDGQARLKSNGSLAGSVLELHQGVKNMYEWGIVSKTDALRMASQSPARSVGIDDVCGILAPGRDADFIVVDDHLELQATYLNGECRYKK